MKKLLLPLLALCALALPARAQQAVAIPRPDPAVAEFARGVKFTVAGYQGGSEVQTNFPVLVRLSTAISGFTYSDFYADGSDLSLVDIGFVDAEGNGLAYEIDTWNPSGESLVWVNLPRMTNGTEFAMWYRSSKTGKELNADSVWADYTGVWHLNESGSAGTSVKDSSTNALVGAAQGLSASVASGRIGGSWRISTVYNRNAAGIKIELDDAAKLGKVNDLGDTFSTSFWMTRKNLETKWCVTGLNRRPDGSTAGWGAQIHDNNAQLRVYGNGGKNTYAGPVGMSGSATANQWGKVDIVWYNDNGTGKYRVYWNGAPVGNGSLNPNTPVTQPTSEPLVIGNFSNATSDRAWSGEMDEVRLIKGVPSAARIKADYDTVNTAAFLTAGTVVEVAVVERPVANLQIVDTGASHVQFGNAISSLGSSAATECDFNVKVWKTAESEPAGYTALASGLTVGALTGRVKGLTPETAYSYKIKVTNDEGVDSDEVTGAFTTSGVGVGGTGGDMTRVGDDWIHYFRVGFDDQGAITNDYVFTPPSYATSVRALVVGGGGPGGYYAGGGGGAGGYYYNETLGVTPGTGYSVHVGEGGVAAMSATAYGSNGGDSSIVGGTVNVVMLGGGAGGNGKQNNQTATLAGQSGGSGGGTAWSGYATGSGTADQGHDGGDVPAGQQQEGLAAGGGGAAAVGGSVEYSSNQQAKGSGTGGNGRSCDITGESLYYAGGGSGGAKKSQTVNGTGTAGAGGAGGGGKGGQYDDTEGSQYATAGADGFGGGGGGGSSYNAQSYQGGNGGNGIVIIRYAAQGDGTDVAAPAISLESLDRDEQTGVTTVGYRVAWAGAGYDDADVAIVWGFRKDELSNTNAIASSMIGRGTGTFTLPDQTKTVYVRVLATNAGGLSSESSKTEKIPFVDPEAPEVALPVVSDITSTGASLSAAVLGLGTGAASVQGVFQVCTDDEFNGTVLSFPATQTLTAAGSLTATATGLSLNTLYYVRVSATNDVPAVFETDPVSFRTKAPGAPNSSVVTDLAAVANPPAECAPPVATDTTITAWGYLFTPGNNGATYADLRLEASTTADFQTVVAYSATETGVTQRGYRSFTLTGLEPETAYYLRLRSENDGRVVKTSDVVGPYTTLAEAAPTAVLTIPALPANVTLVSVTTNNAEVAATEGVYVVEDGATVVATFAPAEGYRLVGDATVTVVMDGDTTLTGIPTAELIPPPPTTATLTIPALPEHVTLVSVTTNGVAISAVEGAYTVLSNDTVTVTFAAAEGYRLVGDATVTVVMDANKTLAGIPTAELIPIPTATLTIPSPLPENVSLVSVTTNGVAVAGVEGAYTVYSNATVVATFAAAQGYALSPAATVTVVVDGDKTLTGIPTAVTIASLIKINEIMASNPSVDKGGIASEKGIAEMDWIELYNGAPVDVDLTGWHLSDNAKPGKEDKATILGSCVIPAGGYKIVWLDKIHVDPSEYAADEAFAVLKLSSSGEFLQLADPSKAVVQQVDFSTKKQIKGVSYGPLSVSSGAGLVPGNGPFVYMKTATPGAPNVTEGFGDFTPAVAFSEPHGYKTAAFDLELSCPDAPTAQIYYTLDGSSPTTASTPYTGAIRVDKTTVIRAAVPVENTILQFDTSATYIFLDDVLAQARSTTAPASAVGFPNDNAVNNQEMLYGMEQSVVTGADRDRLLRGFTNSIATLSVVVDPANLFNSTTGIYVNPRGEGETWERQIMLEGFDPTGVGADFAQPAGIRLRGGNSRSTGKPKHSLRFFFRSSYGESSLAAKMFVGEPLSPNGEGKMKEEIGEYDKLDLRTSQNLSWANENSGNDTFVTEVFSRDSQRDLGQPYTRSRYYNLFINGQYWGLYQTQERGDEHWGEAYLGGDSLQYDLIKTASTYVNNRLSYSIECNEGTWDAWSNLWHIATQEGFGEGHEANYNKVLGLNPDGTRNPAYPILLNAESLMVYMLVSHYVVDQDGPTSPFSSIDKGHANNFYAIRNRDDAGAVKGFVFLRHDAEMSMGQNGNTGASQNPTLWGTEAQTSPTVGSPDPSGLGKLKFRTIPYFTPAELHYLLMQNPVYKRQYADLFYRECLREGGAMTVENATARYTSRMAEIDDAIVCEAARWGKSKTRSNWLNACKTSTTFITNRVGNMKTQYQTAGWYPTVAAPFVTDADGVRYLDGGEVPYQGKVSLQNNDAQGDGTLYYTIDGTDPADSGIEYTAPFSIPDTGATVRARLFKDNEWSPLEEVALEADVPNDQRRYVRIAAIRSHAAIDPDEEFIVITNTFNQAVSLEGLSVWSEKTGQILVKLAAFGEGASIDAGGTVTLTNDDWLLGSDGKKLKLKNGAIDVELRDYNGKLVQLAQIDTATWYPTEEFNDKGKRIFACGGTGRWLIALDFRGAMEGVVLNNPGDASDPNKIVEGKQWTASPAAPAVPLPEDATAQAAVLDLMEYDDRIEPWLVELGQTATGLAAVENFTGSTNALVTCYLVNILPESNPEVELTMPSITFDANGKPVVEGELLNHGTELQTTVRGTLRLYYADSLEDLETTTDYIQISPPTFPVEETDDGSGAPIPNARFYRLKIIQ